MVDMRACSGKPCVAPSTVISLESPPETYVMCRARSLCKKRAPIPYGNISNRIGEIFPTPRVSSFGAGTLGAVETPVEPGGRGRTQETCCDGILCHLRACVADESGNEQASEGTNEQTRVVHTRAKASTQQTAPPPPPS